MNKNNPPPGFSLRFCRHRRSWGWREQYPEDGSPFAKERYGFRSRREANDNSHDEVAMRVRAKAGQARFDKQAGTWHAVASAS